MRVYTVHIAPSGDAPALIKEGFSWPAFFFAPFWALWHRLWWVAALLLAVEFFVGALGQAFLDEGRQWVLSLGLASVIGILANDLHRRTIEGRGWRFADVIAGPDALAALHRYLDHREETVPA